MARRIDSDYMDFLPMGGFDMGIDFDGFEENVKKFIELPGKYLDSAHDKAVEFIEDVHAILIAPFTYDEVSDEEDQSSSIVFTKSSPTSVETELVGPNTEASTPASLITVENSSIGCVDADAHGTESFSSESKGLSLKNHVYSENTSSEGGRIEANNLRLLPEAVDTSSSGLSDCSEEIILWNPETSVKPRPHGLAAIPHDDHAPHILETDQMTKKAGLSEHSDLTTITQDDFVPHILHKDQQAALHCSVHSDILVDSVIFFQALLLEDSRASNEEKMTSYSANSPVEATQNKFVPQALYKEEQAVLHCSGHLETLVDSAVFFEALLLEDSTTNFEEQMASYSANDPMEASTCETRISHEPSSDVPLCADDLNVPTDTMVKSVDIKDLSDDQLTENDKIELSPVPQRNNASFQKYAPDVSRCLQKMFMRNLSSKLRWSKKQVTMHQAMPAGSQDSENLGYRLVSSPDDLEDDWEVL